MLQIEHYIPYQLAFLVTGGLAVSVLLLYRVLLPRPIPGIPYKEASAKRILGDGPDVS